MFNKFQNNLFDYVLFEKNINNELLAEIILGTPVFNDMAEKVSYSKKKNI